MTITTFTTITTITTAVATVAAISLTAFLLVAPTIAMAQNPHFIGHPIGTYSNGVLTVPFKITGLGDESVRITLEGTASTEISCFPSADQKDKQRNIQVSGETQRKEVESSQALPEPVPEQITSTLALQVGPQDISQDACPDPQWEPRAGQVTFQGVILTVEQPPRSIVLSEPVTVR